ncbi:DUF4145 domain-containing protein [Achromobacter xylosoxidans]|uniref:DUF4145 domain-containing protein n=1 Tax=Alcaligenes xylosoxydans xylosoxydans TaxID=85698 RepID=UPI0009BAF55C|nr:DUF4145 domain-containing protein [Achromobacter xylosoxidans]
MTWHDAWSNHIGALPFQVSKCSKCQRLAIWRETGIDSGKMLFPADISAPAPHEDMPSTCVEDYNEAREIAGNSPRGAAALLRLVVQKLCIELGQPGKNINDDIKQLVKAGLPVDAQQALDVLRVTGNNAVHPGEMDIDGDPSLVAASFNLINFIVDQQIAQKKRVANLFAKLPAGAKDAIAKRDSTP